MQSSLPYKAWGENDDLVYRETDFGKQDTLVKEENITTKHDIQKASFPDNINDNTLVMSNYP